MKLQNGKIIYSYDLADRVARYLNSKKKKLDIKNFYKINNKIFIFLQNSYVIQLNITGEIDKIIKLPSSLATYPIIIDNLLLYSIENKIIFNQHQILYSIMKVV